MRIPRAVLLLWTALEAPPAEAAAAYRAWRAESDLEALSGPEFRLLPALAEAIDRLEPEATIRARLRGLQKYCWSHNIHILRTALPVVEGLARAGIPAVALKGGGVIARTPSAIRRRGIRDLDLLVRTGDVPAAVQVLLAEGFRPVTGRIPGRLRAKAFDKPGPANPHAPERIEIDLHHRAMHAGRYGRFDDDLVARSLPGELLGRPIRVLAPVDEALVAIGQALQWDTNPSHPWIGDALSALRAPGFDAAEFWARARARRFDTHAAAVLEWLDRCFGLPPAVLLARPPPRRGPALWLDRAELRAMARPPRARGLPERAALWLAEALRGGWRKPSPPFPTDLGQRLTPSAEAPRPVPPGEEFAWEIADRQDGGRALTVTLAGPPPSRADFDLWFGGVWAARLRLRPLPWQRGARVWTATIPPGLPRGEPALLRAPRRGPEEGAAE
ncbi:MAG: nucleotidyltransferase family protein [Acetobacteraceae bacterium]|nr:nucleotidyltransferase family protein [Acetobacteraceae bacterium]